MSKKILFVDDEPHVLEGYKRALRKQFDIDLALGGAEALALIESGGPYAVIVSDMRMPAMDGVELLASVKQRAPETVRMMLTGNSDQKTAIDAVNKGDIFRFLNKPCSAQVLAAALLAGQEQYRLITAEKELLQKTLAGSIRVLTEILSLVNPEAFGRTARLMKMTRKLIQEMDLAKTWWMEPMVLLSQIGCVTLPDTLLRKIVNGHLLDSDEQALYAKHPGVGATLLGKIPRFEEISQSIQYQEKNFDGTGIPKDTISGQSIPLGARLLKVVLNFDRYESMGLPPTTCIARMKQKPNRYDPEILTALEKILLSSAPVKTREVRLEELLDGMILAVDVKSKNDILIASKGLLITASVKQRLINFHDNNNLSGSLHVVV